MMVGERVCTSRCCWYLLMLCVCVCFELRRANLGCFEKDMSLFSIMSMLHTSFAWWFQILCFLFTPSWGDNLIWLLFFRWVETTNLSCFLQSKVIFRTEGAGVPGTFARSTHRLWTCSTAPWRADLHQASWQCICFEGGNHVKGFWMFFGRFFLKWLGCMGCFGHQINPLVYLVNGVRPSLRRALVRIFHQPF